MDKKIKSVDAANIGPAMGPQEAVAALDRGAALSRLPWYRRRNSIHFQFSARLSRLTGGRIKSPGYYETLDFQREHQAEDLEMYRIQTSEHVQTWCLWTVEFFTPDNVGKLYAALDCLRPAGWEYEDCSPAQWLRQNRGLPGNSIELYFVPTGRPCREIDHYCPLPSFAKAAHGTLENVTPSLTVLTTYFLLEDLDRDWLDNELHRDHPPRIFQKPGGVISTSSVWNEQRRAVETRRAYWISQATDWHRENFPGLLSTNGEQVSSCVLDVVDAADPFGEGLSNLLESLDLKKPIELFESMTKDEQRLLHLSRKFGTDGIGGRHLLSIRRDCLGAFDAPGYGGDDSGRIAHLDAMFRRTYTWIALPRVLDFYERRAVLARDGAAKLVGTRLASRALARVRADTAQSIDAAVIARELGNAAKSGWLPRCEMDFTLRPMRMGQKPLTLAKALHDRITQQSAELLADVEALNDSLTVQANLLSAHANLKLQPWIIGLAAVSMIAAVAAAIGPVRDMMSSKADKPLAATYQSGRTDGIIRHARKP